MLKHTHMWSKHTLLLDGFIGTFNSITLFWCNFQVPQFTTFKLLRGSAPAPLGELTVLPQTSSWWGRGLLPAPREPLSASHSAQPHFIPWRHLCNAVEMVREFAVTETLSQVFKSKHFTGWLSFPSTKNEHMSTQPSIPLGYVNWVPACMAGVCLLVPGCR